MVSAAAFGLVVSAVLAASSPPEAPSGRRAFAQATAAFQVGRLKVALPLFETAYRDSGHRPSTVLALAQCHRRMQHSAEALELYEEFLRRAPAHALALDVRATIVQLKAALPQIAVSPALVPPLNKAPASPKVVLVAPTQPDPSMWSESTPWIVAGAAVVLASVAAGIAFRDGPPDAGSTGVVIEPLVSW